MSQPIKVIQLGLGFIGQGIFDILTERDGFQVVAAVDPDPAKADVLPGIKAVLSLAEALAKGTADVAVLTTTSRMDTITPQILELLENGLHVVSTCEELVYPWDTAPKLAASIDQAARDSGLAVLSTGVNPGFLMDFLPIAVSRIARKVDSVLVERYQNAMPRREAFQRKIGAGLTVDEFWERVKVGNFGHAGLTASVQLLAAGLGMDLDTAGETIEPVIAEQAMTTDFLSIKAGDVAGVYQVGVGNRDGKELIRLVFRAAVGEPESFDRISLTGTPDLVSVFPSGVPGDVATGAITVNAIPPVMSLKPGLRTMVDLWPTA